MIKFYNGAQFHESPQFYYKRKAEARRHAEDEARQRAVQEARRQAEEVARQRAFQDARRRAAEDSSRSAEEVDRGPRAAQGRDSTVKPMPTPLEVEACRFAEEVDRLPRAPQVNVHPILAAPRNY